MTEHYLDNAATTRPSEDTVAVIERCLTQDWGNPSSLHRKGQEAERHIVKARRTIARILMTSEESIFFTSGSTESSNTAIMGAASRLRHKGMHILTGKSEHPATAENLKRLQEEGYQIEEVDNDPTGKILLDDLKAKIRPDTILVTCLYVNNETGCINPIREMGKIIKETNPDCLFHVDATQAFCKYPLYPDKWGIDLISASAHKINGPKGIGLLYIRRGLHIPSLIVGGGQEMHFRSGTENVPYIAGFGQAADELWAQHKEIDDRLMALKLDLAHRLQTEIDGVCINGPKPEDGACHIINFRVDGVRSEVLLHALEDDGIYVSSGSACSSNKPGDKSRALAAIGLDADQIDHAVRVSFDRFTTKEDTDALVDSLKRQVPVLRQFIRK